MTGKGSQAGLSSEFRKAQQGSVFMVSPRLADVLLRDESGRVSASGTRELTKLWGQIRLAKSQRRVTQLEALKQKRQRLMESLFPRFRPSLEQQFARHIRQQDANTGFNGVVLLNDRPVLEALGPKGYRKLMESALYGVTEPLQTESPRRVRDEGIYLSLVAAHRRPQIFHDHDTKEPMLLSYVAYQPGEKPAVAASSDAQVSRPNLQDVPFVLSVPAWQKLSGQALPFRPGNEADWAKLPPDVRARLESVAVPLSAPDRFYHPKRPVGLSAMFMDGTVLHGTLPKPLQHAPFTTEQRAQRAERSAAFIRDFYDGMTPPEMTQPGADFNRVAIARDNHFCG